MRVGFQGIAGAFSDEAARTLAPGAETLGFATFDGAIDALALGTVDAAVLPCENAIAGAIPRTYDLLWERLGLRIAGETTVPVAMQLVGAPGSAIEDVREVRTHPVALEQVRRFLDARPEWRRVTHEDTAGAIRDVVRAADPAVAAIGSSLAAGLYGGEILRADVHDDPGNATRFFLLVREHDPPPEPPPGVPARACVALHLPNERGALRDALSAFADRGIDLSALLARPDRVDPFRYRFYVEIGGVDDARLRDALAAIAGDVRVLGRYALER